MAMTETLGGKRRIRTVVSWFNMRRTELAQREARPVSFPSSGGATDDNLRRHATST